MRVTAGRFLFLGELRDAIDKWLIRCKGLGLKRSNHISGPVPRFIPYLISKPSPRFGLSSQHIEKQETNGGVRIVYDAIRHLSPPSEDFYRIFLRSYRDGRREILYLSKS